MVRVDLTTRFSYGVACGVEHSEFPLQVEGDHYSRGNNYYNKNNKNNESDDKHDSYKDT